MAAPDRAYRFFTNLISKTVEGNTTVKHYIRCAKPLLGYVGSVQSLADQAEAFKAKFKVDGILWVKNPSSPCAPKTALSNPKTVIIHDPRTDGQQPISFTSSNSVSAEEGATYTTNDENYSGVTFTVLYAAGNTVACSPSSTVSEVAEDCDYTLTKVSGEGDSSISYTNMTFGIPIEDPDLDDPNRDGIIAYVYPSGENARYHDMATSVSSPRTQFNASDASIRAWTRASKFRFKKSGDTEAAIILNDAGLNRLGDCELQPTVINGDDFYCVPYIDTSNMVEPRYNDCVITGKFFSTPYNRMYFSKLQLAEITSVSTDSQTGETTYSFSRGWVDVANGGPIGRTGIAGNPDTPTIIKFVGRKHTNPEYVEQNRTAVLNFGNSNSLLLEGIEIVQLNQTAWGYGVDNPVGVNLPTYAAKLITKNEEGEVESEIKYGLEFLFYKWNTDDSKADMYAAAENNSNTDRISLSHASPEKSIERYNDKLPLTVNQYDLNSVEDDPDPYPVSVVEANHYLNNGVRFIYTPTNTFVYRRDPEGGREGLQTSIDTMVFFTDEEPTLDANLPTYKYSPLLTGPYQVYQNPGGGASQGDEPSPSNEMQRFSSFLTLRCNIHDKQENETGIVKSGVFCLEYTIYVPPHVDTYYAAIRRYWDLAYDGSIWYWPKSRYNQNVSITVVIAPLSSGSQGLLSETSLTPGTEYGISVLVKNVTKGERFAITITNLSYSSSDGGGNISIYAKTGESSYSSTQSQEVQYQNAPLGNTAQESTGKAMRISNIAKLIRKNGITFTDIAKFSVKVDYYGYTDMRAPLTERSVTKTITTIGYSADVSGVRTFNAYSEWGSVTPFDQGAAAAPSDVLRRVTYLPTHNNFNDAVYYISRATGKLCTDEQGNVNATQGYYITDATVLSAGNGEWTATADPSNIFYVDAQGNISSLNDGNNNGGGNSSGGSSGSGSESGGNSGTPGGNTGGLDNGS